jgi:carboxypeptidase Taq
MSSPAANSAYRELEARFRRLASLGEALAVLHWDSSLMMPAGGSEARAEQIATLKVLKHEILTDPALPGLLDAAESEVGPARRSPSGGSAAGVQLTEMGEGAWRAANLREMRRARVHAAGVPAALVEAHSKACHACEMVWRDARPADDFARVAPALAEVVRLTREVAVAKAAALNGVGAGRDAYGEAERLSSLPLDTATLSPYEALLDQYEPGGRTARIDALFADLAAFLPGFLDDVLARQAAAPAPLPLPGPFPTKAQ